MKRLETKLEGPILLQPTFNHDERGFFMETYRRNAYADLGIDDDFVQDNHSRSRQGVVRGMHFQPGMAKLLRCARGVILDVVADVRRGSPTFGRWESFELSDDNGRQLYCPDGFAHGFCVITDVADLVYRCSAYYDPKAEGGFAYDDPDVGIEWPAVDLLPSARDSDAPRLREMEADLPFTYKP